MVDGRQNPRRLKVAPPPDGRRPSDWRGREIETSVILHLHGESVPVGTQGTVICGSHGGSGLTIRLATGVTCGGITHQHIRLAQDQRSGSEHPRPAE